ncbi:hypothetical protein RBLE17_24620 [Rhodobacteraceae bacterium LE17]|nr:hypothetical protein [Rhodobacteraceae bacterium LE17]
MAEILIEGSGVKKHCTHIRHSGGVPPRYVSVKDPIIPESKVHIRHKRCVPILHIPIARGVAVVLAAASDSALVKTGCDRGRECGIIWNWDDLADPVGEETAG